MDIAALSTGMHQAGLAQSISLATTKMVMDTTTQNANQMIEMMNNVVPQAPHPTLGKSIDLKG